MPEGCAKVIVDGTTGVGKKTVMRHMLGTEDLPPPEPSFVEGFVCFPLHIDTKYYETDVDVWMCQWDSDTTVEARLQRQETSCALSTGCEAFIFVFDRTRPETFGRCKLWESFVDAASPSVRLCVGNKADLVSPSDKESETEWFDWCLAHNFEFVNACATDALGSGGGGMLADEGGEGVARVVDALQCNEWSAVRLKGEAGNPTPGEEEDSDDHAWIATTEDYYQALDSGGEEGHLSGADTPGEEERNEDQVDDLERAFTLFAQTRDHARHLSDDHERREAAAETAMRLWNILKLGEEGEGEEEEKEEEKGEEEEEEGEGEEEEKEEEKGEEEEEEGEGEEEEKEEEKGEEEEEEEEEEEGEEGTPQS